MTTAADSLSSRFPEVAAEWDFEENGGLTPDQVTAGSHKKVHWRCRKSGHQWEAAIFNRAKGRGCPVCSNTKVLAGFNDLESQFPEVAVEWDYEEEGPLEVPELRTPVAGPDS
ncbi:zinc-ribbon domain-containing protein [Rhodococcus sp. LB1]|uniref:zinc-ribbon domain-containing protein n=1 Tax=Rhodococcus sp. LB1 TaxID=1807499 RepID=UPI00077A7E64|nr:zinc-ribbon domain-containing protein [Rhodococcus sp. LB1]KXX54558.1 hypothetical protein AZG88_03035 [Rhodococcus sp. LB1]